MNTERILILLNLLSRNTSAHSNELNRLYRQALDENDDLAALRNNINNNTFYGAFGENMLADARNLLNMMYQSPVQAADNLNNVRNLNDSIAAQVRHSKDVIASPLAYSDTVSVMENGDIAAYYDALRLIASSVVYLTLLYCGTDPVRLLMWNDSSDIKDRINIVNSVYMPLLSEIERTGWYWVITKRSPGTVNVFQSTVFEMSYVHESNLSEMCRALTKERMGTHAFLNVRAYENSENDVPFCWGTGNIVSHLPDSALNMLQTEITTRLRYPTVQEMNEPMPKPFVCARKLSIGPNYCISPDELLVAMNRWTKGREILLRERAGKCLICGKNLNGDAPVCTEHFGYYDL